MKRNTGGMMIDKSQLLTELTERIQTSFMSNEERHQTLKNIERRRAELLTQLEEIQEELVQMEAIELAHQAALRKA